MISRVDFLEHPHIKFDRDFRHVIDVGTIPFAIGVSLDLLVEFPDVNLIRLAVTGDKTNALVREPQFLRSFCAALGPRSLPTASRTYIQPKRPTGLACSAMKYV